jgi:hypothetical protein
MSYFSKDEWHILQFQRSKAKNKKYAVILRNTDGKKKTLNFGDKRYENYQDATGLGLYNNLIHNDKERRRLYRLRHKKDLKDGYYSSGYFSYYYLW